MIQKQGILIEGMHCNSCVKIIRKQAFSLNGVTAVNVDFATGEGWVEFDSSKTDIDSVLDKIEEKGYAGFILKELPKAALQPVQEQQEQQKHGAQFHKSDSQFHKSGSHGSHKTDARDSHQHGKECDDCIPESKSGGSGTSWLGYALAVIGVLILTYFALQLYGKFDLPELSPTMGYGLIFLFGLLTGLHCIAMCGGFVVSYSAKAAAEGKSPHASHFAYGSGKVISYTFFGAVFGLLGSLIVFTPALRGFAGILAGLFLVLFGLGMLFPLFRRFRLGMPGFLTKAAGKAHKDNYSSPLVIGLLNGLMIACGPLQAMYIMAAGTGSWLEGAKLLFIFGLGTLPAMIGFGYFASAISSKMTQKILKISGVVVIVLGLIMINRGLSLTGTGYDAESISQNIFGGAKNSANSNYNSGYNSPTANAKAGSGSAGSNSGSNSNAPVIKDGYQEIRMDVTYAGYSPNKFVLKKGVPVRWIITGKELSGCNNAIQSPKLGLNFDVKNGVQTIEFTPNEAGTIPFTCWMGMLRGTFIVKDDIDLADTNAVQKELNNVQVPKGGSCGAGGGGCGCGGAR